ncbi:MAG: hydroxymethylglutaryl-CoA lyase [Thermodesulfobacteriota bacterium]|nr:hydroxymethylglutaryl-CoA lyase [Thermodesulfobacteriota bacterium]
MAKPIACAGSMMPVMQSSHSARENFIYFHEKQGMNRKKMKLPGKVTLIEVGPRDGFQLERKLIPTELKLSIINGLIDAGIRNIQVTSFVNPDLIPQMGDAEELIKLLPENKDVFFSSLVLNEKGLLRARKAGIKHVEISVSASDAHSRKNTGMSHEAAFKSARKMIEEAKSYNMRVRAGIQCAFGCAYEGSIPAGRVIAMAGEIAGSGADMIAVSDTTGMANPLSVKELLGELMPVTNNRPVVLHLHDTRGLGLANVLAGLESGITHFDTALAGMGGCPFVPGAAGNIPTEDTAYMMKSMGISTGIDIGKVAVCSLELESFFGKKFPGKIHRLYSCGREIKL